MIFGKCKLQKIRSGVMQILSKFCHNKHLTCYLNFKPSFSGCRRQDLERIAGQSRLHNITFVLSAPSENIFVPEILLIALQWT